MRAIAFGFQKALSVRADRALILEWVWSLGFWAPCLPPVVSGFD
jgi:hypothetical protein